MNELITSLTPAFEKLAQIFNTSADFVQAHAMEYILMYGKYDAISGILCWFLLLLPFFGAIYGLLGFLFFFPLSELMDIKENVLMRRLVVVCVALTIATALLISLNDLFLYAMCPEAYSIHAVMELVQK